MTGLSQPKRCGYSSLTLFLSLATFLLSSIAAPLIFTTGLFSFFTSSAAPFTLPGAPFFLGSLLLLAGLVVTARLFRRIPVTE